VNVGRGFLQNDPSVPEKVRATYTSWGLCKDEFQDTGGWPHQLYVREARRLLGEYVLTQQDLQAYRSNHDTIGMAGFNIDIREVQWVSVRVFRFPNAQDETLVEGYVSQPVEPWDIPYRAILPRYSECSNLLVPVCISASTVAYASFRMEPNYMIAGHSAGVAAASDPPAFSPGRLTGNEWRQAGHLNTMPPRGTRLTSNSWLAPHFSHRIFIVPRG
jgi:hypothetical protein